MSKRVAVVGAGMAGLVSAGRLSAAGCEVVVLDKGRSPAGRMSTRRQRGSEFDHGAQYFTADDQRFAAAVRGWIGDGSVAEWRGRFGSLANGAVEPVSSERARYVGRPTMSAVARRLASDLEVHSGLRVTRLEPAERGWRVTADDGSQYHGFDTVIVTTPAPQAVPLLEAAPELAARASQARLRACWALMIAFEERLDFEWDGVFVQGSAISWAARNSSKPDRPAGEAWVVHAGPDWSDAHAELPAADVAGQLSVAFADALQHPLPRVQDATAHRWRFALPDPVLEDPCLFDGERGIGAAGDWCGGPRVEGAFLSGAALAERVLGRT